MIQAIVYDAVGTLIHPEPSVAAQYAEIGRRFGSLLKESEIRVRFRAAFARQERIDAQNHWRTSEGRERQRWQAIVAEVLDDVADPAGCFEALFAKFAEPSAWRLDADASQVLATLHARGYRQAVASNFDGRLHGLLAAMPATAAFESVQVSSEVGWRKPAPEFFEVLFEMLGLPPSSILFVGDDRVNDFEPARRAGMRAVLLDPQERHSDLNYDRLARLELLLARL